MSFYVGAVRSKKWKRYSGHEARAKAGLQKYTDVVARSAACIFARLCHQRPSRCLLTLPASKQPQQHRAESLPAYSLVVSFGFSIGDVVAGISLVRTIIIALFDNAHRDNECRELFLQHCNLETVLSQVQQLEVEESLHAELTALRQATFQYQNAIEDFWNQV